MIPYYYRNSILSSDQRQPIRRLRDFAAMAVLYKARLWLAMYIRRSRHDFRDTQSFAKLLTRLPVPELSHRIDVPTSAEAQAI